MIGVIILGIGGYFAYNSWHQKQEQQAAEKVASNFLQAIKKQKFNQLAKFLQEESLSKNGYTVQSMQKKYQTIFTGIQAQDIKSQNISIAKKNNQQYTLNYTLEMSTPLGKLSNLNYQATLKKIGKNYLIEWTPTLIFPKMEKNDKVSIQTNEAERGKIVDRNDNDLAVNQELDQVGIVPGKLGENEQQKEETIKKIGQQFHFSDDEINKKLAQSWVQSDSFVPLTISDSPVNELPQGTMIQKTKVRYYPLKEAAAQLIGYTGQVTAEEIKNDPSLASEGMVGKTGLEKYYDKQLRGQSGGTLMITDEKNNEKTILQKMKKQDGQTLHLTIDQTAQKQAFSIFDNKPGSAIIKSPQQGDLLAVVSSPSYDPNKMVAGISSSDYDAYLKDKNSPFTARYATRYAPGSTFKTITGAIGLDANTLKPNESLPISGLKWQKNHDWGDYYVTRVKADPLVDLKTALVHSDNIYFAQQTLRMGKKTFKNGLDKFIFGEDLKLPFEMQPAQISNHNLDSEILLADTGYGQGQLLLSPIQQATVFSVFQNNGSLVYPKLKLDQPRKIKANVISKSSANLIADDLLGSVEDETGYVHNMYNPAFSLAAKTGTAEIKNKQDTLGTENSFLLTMDRSNNKFLTVIMTEDSRKNNTPVNIGKPLIDYLEANIK